MWGAIKNLPQPIKQKMLAHHVATWLVCDNDAHAGQFLYTSDKKGVVRIDAGQAYKHVGKDWLTPKGDPKDFTHGNYYIPNNPPPPVMHALMCMYAKGEIDLDFDDPEFLKAIIRAENLADEEIRKSVEPYANAIAAELGKDAEKLIKKAIARKKTIRKDFEKYVSKVMTARNGAATVWKFGKPKVLAGGGVLPIAKTTGRVLVGRRSKIISRPGQWNILGGAADHPGETIKEAALREFEEETKYPKGSITDVKHLHSIQGHDKVKDKPFAFHGFLGFVLDEFAPISTDGETDKFLWVDWDELTALEPKHPALLKIMTAGAAQIYAAMMSTQAVEEEIFDRGVGMLAVAQDTGRFLLAEDDGGWAPIYGAAFGWELEESAARREFRRDVGYTGPLNVRQLYEYSKPWDSFRHTTFLGVVPQEFPANGHRWVSLDEMVELPKHHGLDEAMEHIDSWKMLNEAAVRYAPACHIPIGELAISRQLLNEKIIKKRAMMGGQKFTTRKRVGPVDPDKRRAALKAARKFTKAQRSRAMKKSWAKADRKSKRYRQAFGKHSAKARAAVH
jgi:8-oxo-dGTP pyrophosphatase MutT (NUDIX family)